MRSFYKVTLLATSVAFMFSSAVANASPTQFKTDEERTAYALGASFVESMDQFYKQQEKLGFKLDKKQLAAGVNDAIEGKSKLTSVEVIATLQEFDKALQEKAAQVAEQEKSAAVEKGQEYRDTFAKEKGVVKTKSGLLYKVVEAGQGDVVKETDTVVVHYKGTLIDGTEFDSSYKRDKPATFPLNSVISGWTEGLQQIKKGGKIKLVVPPELAYGEQQIGTIPGSSTLVFDVELLDVNPKEK